VLSRHIVTSNSTGGLVVPQIYSEDGMEDDDNKGEVSS